MPPDVAIAMAHLDAQSATWPEETRGHWIRFRGYARKTERVSQQALPAVSVAAQEMIAARDHAHRAIEHMQGVFGHGEDKSGEDDKGSKR